MVVYELSSKEEVLSFQATCELIMYSNMWKQYHHIMFYNDCPSDKALTFSDESPDWSEQGQRTLCLCTVANDMDAKQDDHARQASKKQAGRVAKMQPYESFGGPSTLTLNPTPISSSGSSNPTPSFPPLDLLFTLEEMIKLQGSTSQEIELHSALAEGLLMELIPSTGLSTDVTEQEVLPSLEQDSSPMDIDLAESSSCNPGSDFCHQDVIYIPPPVHFLCISHTRHTIVNTLDAHVLRAFISAGKHCICVPHTPWFEEPIDFSYDFLKECVAVIPPLTELAFLTTDSGPSDPSMLIVECLWQGMCFQLGWRKQFGFHLHPDTKPFDLIDQDVTLAPVSTMHSWNFFEEWHLKLMEFVQLEGVECYLQYGGLVACILYQLLGEPCLDKVIKGLLMLFMLNGG
jgi:hypothetical protein